MIKAKELVKTFGCKAALDHMSFSIDGGSIFGLVGSNGAGKSTFLRTLAGVYRPDGGELLVDGEPTFENSRIKGRICFIPDYPYFIPQSTPLEMGTFLSRIYPRWDWSMFQKLNRIFPIGAKKKISTMSKGMQRQAALICALSARPDYLLMDEIFDGLDPVMRQLLKRLISDEVSSRKMTVIIASHNLRELEDFCDHIGLFHKGGVLFEKDIDELKLGICKVQAAFKPNIPGEEAFAPLNIVKWETHGSLVSLVARAGREEVLQKVNSFHPVFSEVLPLTLEEIFICEMEAVGYDIDNILA